MKINTIIFKNFRPFYGCIEVNLAINSDKNIVLIGGKNGHGKTNFLLGIVWCLYGKLISNVDDSFKIEVANNYSKFLDSVLNKDKKSEGEKKFSVELLCSDVSYGDNNQKSTIIVKRSYDIKSQKENLTITSNDDELLLAVSTKEEKQNFINDYLVPIAIARFVFFDAEKISQIADLNPTRQAKLMNKTLGNMLLLNIYQNLLDEVTHYIKILKKESSPYEVQIQIDSHENAINLSKKDIERKKIILQEKNAEITQTVIKIEQLEIQINKKGGDNTDINILHKQRSELEKQRDEMQKKFSNMVNIIPLFMLSGLMQEAKEHIEIEQTNKESELSQEGFTTRVDLFIEGLFNQGEPPNPDISLKQKIFYTEKSKNLISYLTEDNQQNKNLLSFTHSLDSSKIKDLTENYQKIQAESGLNFINIIEGFSKKKAQLNQLEKDINKLEIGMADELTKGFIIDKNNAQNCKDELNKKIGGIENDISKLELKNSTYGTKLKTLYAKSKANKENQAKIEFSEKYIKVLNEFISSEKQDKKETIKGKLLAELSRLWHKKLVKGAELTILPNDKGLEVVLLDNKSNPINSKELAKGEQQIYVSALLKAILDSSIHNLPVFIDTPLARLDSEHRDNILKLYYPDLSAQVVIFSTDTEITSTKYTEIEQHIERSYLIEHIDGKSSISEGYFN